ncbi:MAG: RidA family protein [Acidimicrobiales bacterium]
MRDAINPEGAVAVGPYSSGVRSGDFVFCSGQTPIDPTTKRLRTGGVGSQTIQCLNNLAVVLAGADLTPDDVVKVNVFLTHMSDFDQMNTAYAEFFNEPFPARSTIGVAGLPLGASVEIELVAQVRSS